MNVHEVEQETARFLDATRNSATALWAALLTFDAIFAGITASQGVGAGLAGLISTLVLILAVLSALMLLRNFAETREVYYRLGPVV